MRLTVIGCSGSFPGPHSPASCYLVEAGGLRVVVDLGNGALGELQRHVDIYAVDAVLLSHLHADHCLDLCAYYVARKYRPGGPAPQIPVYGPRGSGARLARAYDLPEEPGMNSEFHFLEHGREPYSVGPLTVTPVRVVHPVEAYALRIDHGGHGVVYSGDTAPSEALVDLARGADLLVCEASFVEGGDNPPGLHLTGRQAGRHAAEAGVPRLVLTHVPPWTDGAVAVAEASEVYGGDLQLASSGLVVEL
ncbi:MAG TPA: MBL fold metallo-hydrolase [Jiangellales bacterium]|nr:MBL fold metallo-hydrolase [Jiangellales bacterium]